ncbi:uncharacterized protein LOC110458165 [Mizuhopecten yessoensis]|uniref:Uncharacterized protein n=1 Tax=Mizuhopecten yessoensis TaxID=6573 RepID=A0A210Q781_MIZYE|nr:uncharacterized protein LOC110458165 [Mizuhopecten yessoensis]OWF44593.1 hypothetical protein KP79_PYT12082 [Mizuhopecten yessoensis]
MDRKPPRPRTLALTPPSGKKQIKVSRQRKTASWVSKNEKQHDLRYLANDIKSIIQGISFEKSTEASAEATDNGFMRRAAYIGVRRSTSSDDNRRLSSRRSDVVSSFYRERQERDHHTRESMHIARRAALQDVYNEERGELANSSSLKRISCPWDMYYDTDRDECRSLQMMAKELRHVQDVREKEVRDLLAVNTKLQDNLFESDQEICVLQESNAGLEGRLTDMLQVYERIKGNLKRCLAKVKDLEKLGKLTGNYSDDEIILRNGKGDKSEVSSVSSGFNTLSESEIISLGPGYEGDGEGSICADISRQLDDAINGTAPLPGLPVANISGKQTDRPPVPSNTPRSATPSNDLAQISADKQFIGRLQADVNSLSEVNSEQSKEIERLRCDLMTCRKHMMTSQFQLEAVEIECGRLLSMEDQLISVITLLKRAREQHVHRQLLGDIMMGAIAAAVALETDASPGLCAESFLRELQEQLSLHPVLMSVELLEGAVSSRVTLSNVEKVSRQNKSLLEDLKFIDDEDCGQLSDNDSFHSLGIHLNDHDDKAHNDSE